MSGRLFLSYSAADGELVAHLKDFLQAALRPEWIATTEHDPRVSQSGVDPVRQADAVLGVLSNASMTSGQVPFALGSAYSLSKPVVLLVAPDVDRGGIAMPCYGSGPFALDGLGSLATMARELATLLGGAFEMTDEASEAIDRMMPPEPVPAALGTEDEVDDNASTLVGRAAPHVTPLLSDPSALADALEPPTNPPAAGGPSEPERIETPKPETPSEAEVESALSALTEAEAAPADGLLLPTGQGDGPDEDDAVTIPAPARRDASDTAVTIPVQSAPAEAPAQAAAAEAAAAEAAAAEAAAAEAAAAEAAAAEAAAAEAAAAEAAAAEAAAAEAAAAEAAAAAAEAAAAEAAAAEAAAAEAAAAAAEAEAAEAAAAEAAAAEAAAAEAAAAEAAAAEAAAAEAAAAQAVSDADDELEEDMKPAGEVVEIDRSASDSNRPSEFPSALPSCLASLEAGRAFSECVFNRDDGHDFAAELDGPFGSFIAALGGNWNQMREIGDVEVWMESADNVLAGLSDGEDHVRSWYDVGFCIATLISIIGFDASEDDPERQELGEVANESLEGFREAAAEAGFSGDEVDGLVGRFQNLLGPESDRDYTHMASIQGQIRSRAGNADGVSLSR